jgi:hypothetical protein
MARYTRFTFLCDASERRAIKSLADSLRRSQSDAVRFVVVAAARELSAVNHAGNQAQKYEPAEGNNEQPR